MLYNFFFYSKFKNREKKTRAIDNFVVEIERENKNFS